ncbi:MAG: hypothetical protein C0403_12360 [Desulfobacterium sp.]|nr:hypothetical protein [Desulfobacterium sp.]
MTKKIRQVCKCESCGNEAEMVLTCSLKEYEAASGEGVKEGHPHKRKGNKHPKGHKHQVKATGTCTSCGNEADMWIDI